MAGLNPPRVLLALVALPLVAGFGILARDEAVGQSAASRIHHHPDMSAVEWQRALDQLQSAEFLDPGTDWRVRRASYLLLRDRATAARVAESVVAREPDNLNAWVVLWRATEGRDRERASEASDQITRLNPAPLGG